MVFKTHAGDLDSFDRQLPRRRSRPRATFANQLPVNPAGDLRQQKSDLECAGKVKQRQRFRLAVYADPRLIFDYQNPERRRRFALLRPRSKSQKEDQCQEN